MARDHRDGSDRPIAWLFQSCRGKWIFNIDDDEVPSPRLIALLPSLVRRDDLTHCWISRRWLYRTPRTYLRGWARPSATAFPVQGLETAH